ncbi:MAG: rubrerythrin [uncultured bacterium (gcode 4)]|uniref:Rubrerythrin n=1 Tax=uncultured bacterium (gcode 4) TaxID=1234023 RepID=K2H0A1_9BACT|nr:MAG: rubrerythrin [uncultured bacterium (gcode 4)]
MESIRWTQTEKNLLKAFAWESQARTRYDYFASQAKKEGFEQISAIFTETALNEKEHAKRFFKFLEWWMVEITASYPAWIIKSTMENLEAAANWELEEWWELYPEFARIAQVEWFPEISAAFNLIAEVEKEHERRYRKLRENILKNEVFSKSEEKVWKCRNCWFHAVWKNAPDECPACKHPQAHYELFAENY